MSVNVKVRGKIEAKDNAQSLESFNTDGLKMLDIL